MFEGNMRTRRQIEEALVDAHTYTQLGAGERVTHVCTPRYRDV